MSARPIPVLHAREVNAVIMVKGKEKAYQEKLQALDQGFVRDRYDSFLQRLDAMLILHEGVALLIVMALRHLKGHSDEERACGTWWELGCCSCQCRAIALILQVAFPAVTSGVQLEIIEGGVGLWSAMILIGIWPTSPSNSGMPYGPSNEDSDGYRKLCLDVCPQPVS